MSKRKSEKFNNKKAEELLGKFFTTYSEARKDASVDNKKVEKLKSRLNAKLAQKLDSAGFSNLGEGIVNVDEKKPGFFSRLFSGFAARPVLYIGGGFLSAAVIFAGLAFMLIYYRGANIPGIFDMTEKSSPILSLVKQQETQYGVVASSNRFTIKATDGSTFRSLGIANRVSVEPKIDAEVVLSEDGSTLTVEPKESLQPDTEYSVTVKKGTMFSNGSALAQDMTWTFRTEPEFAVVGITPRDGSVGAPIDTSIEIEFNYKDLDVNAFKNYFSITPKLTGRFELHGKKIVFLPSARLAAGTDYKIVVKKGFPNGEGAVLPQDYQSIFTAGYELGSGKTISQTSMWWSDDSPVLSVTRDLGIGLDLIHISKSTTVTVYNCKQLGMVKSLKTLKNGFFEKPDSSYLTKYKTLTLTPKQAAFFKVDFDDYGIYFIEAVNPEYGRSLFKFVIYTPVGELDSFAKDTVKTWVFDMNQKKPISGATVKYFDLDASDTPIATDKTDSNGYAEVADSRVDLVITEYAGRAGIGLSPKLGTHHWWESSYYDSFVEYDTNYRAVVLTDKPLYKPGDTVNFKVIVRKENDLAYELPISKVVKVKVGSEYYFWTGIRDLPIFEKTYEVSSDFGTVTGSFVLPTNNDIGYERISIELDDKAIGYGGIEIANYVKPEVQLNLSVSKTRAFNGETVRVEIKGEDYSGNPASGKKVTYNIYRGQIDNANWFESIDEMDPDNIYADWADNDVEKTVALDSTGKAVFTFTASTSGFGTNLGLYEVSTHSVGSYDDIASERVVVSANSAALFAKASRYSLPKGEDNTLTFRTVNLWDFTRKGGVRIVVNDITRTWNTWEADGTYYDPVTKTNKTYLRSVPHITSVLQNQELTTNASGEAQLNLTNLDEGTYKMTATFYNSQGIQKHFTDLFYVYASTTGGGIPSDWEFYTDKFKIYTDKDKYDVGDTATITIKTTLTGKGVFMIQRGDVYDWRIVDFSSGLVTVREDLTNKMAPNISICAWAIDEYSSMDNPEDGISSVYLTNIFSDSCKQVTVVRDYGKLNVDITSNKSTYRPGEEVELNVVVTDSSGKGVPAELAISSVDKALLDLASFNDDHSGFNYNVHASFYEMVQQWNSVSGSMFAYSYAGGMNGSGGMGDETVRSIFPDVAYWNGRVLTDNAGRVTVKFKLPDSLTTWVTRAVAVTADTWVGEDELRFTSKMEISLDATVPQFLRAGDAETQKITLKNYSSKTFNGKITGTCGGCVVRDISKGIIVGAGKQASIEIPVAPASTTKEIDLVLNAVAGTSTYDSIEHKIPVLGKGFAVGKTGSLLLENKSLQSNLSFEIPEGTDVSQATLELNFARSFIEEGALGSVDPSVKSSVDLASSILRNSVFYKYYDQIKPSESKDEFGKKIKAAYALLVNNQAEDGGFGWFDYDAVNFELSAYVGIALGSAVDAGALPRDTVISGLEIYLNKGILRDTTSIDEQILAVYALAKLGDGDILPYAIWLKNNVGGFKDSPLDIAHLMLALQALGDDGDAGELADTLAKLAEVTGRSATWQDKDTGFRVVNSVDYTTAVAYLALYKYENIAVRINARNWLIDNPADIYGNSVDSVGIFYALAIPSLENIEGRVGVNKVTLKVNGQNVRTFDVGGDKNDISKVSISVDAKYLKAGKNSVRVERSGEGQLYVVGNLTYYTMNAPQTTNEFQIVRSLRDFKTGKLISTAKVGQTVIVHTEVKVDRDGHNLVLKDFVPSGFEPVQYQLGKYNLDFAQKWWEWGSTDYTNKYGMNSQNFVTFTEDLFTHSKVYKFEYPMIAVHKGTFSLGGADSYMLNFEDIGGAITSGTVTITD